MAFGPTIAVVKVGAEDKDDTLMKKAKPLVKQGWISGIQESSTLWKEMDGVNSLLCGPANALKPPSHETCNYQGSVNQE